MFNHPPALHFFVPKKHHSLLAILATCLLMFGSIIIALSLGTDHWRELTNTTIQTNETGVLVVAQGLRKECDKSKFIVKCIKITKSKFVLGLLGPFDIAYCLLIEALVLSILCNIVSIVASFHKRAILVTCVLALEITSALIVSMVLVCFALKCLKSPWKAGWSYYLAWLSWLSIIAAGFLHFIVQDVKFMARRICK